VNSTEQKPKGMIQVYTGNGKGKTTAALGLALRAVGHGRKVFIIQFLKGSQKTGEIISAKKLEPLLIIKPMGRIGFANLANPGFKDRELAQKALDEAWRLIRYNVCDILILDEINIATAYNLIPLEDVLKLMDAKPDGMELVMTGRYALPEITRKADLVTEMKNLKHYYDKGVPDRISSER
jgi:cob(I)alamin adenosyltransferase